MTPLEQILRAMYQAKVNGQSPRGRVFVNAAMQPQQRPEPKQLNPEERRRIEQREAAKAK